MHQLCTDDFNISPEGVNLTFPQNSSVGMSHCFTFIPIDDNINEGDEEFILSIVAVNSNDGAIAGEGSFTVVIQDNDSKFLTSN